MEIEARDNLSEIIRKLKERSGEGGLVSLNVPRGSPLLKNLLNVKILLDQAEKLGIILKLESGDPKGRNLLARLSEAPPELGFAVGIDVAGREPRSELNLKKIFKSRWARRVLLWLIFLSLAVVGIFAALFTFPRASIRLQVRSETLVQSFELLASPSASIADKDQKILPAVLLEVREEGEQKAEATGKREEGEKARGEVTIYNWTDDDKTFKKDSIITLIRVEGEKLRFLLDKEATVSAQTISISTTTEERTATYSPGKKIAAVAAEKVGEEYNIDGGEEFSVQGLSTDDFLAQNSADFTGGKKQEITVVTSEDQTKLRDKLKEELSIEAQSALESRTVGDQKLHPEAVVIDVLIQNFDKDVDEEAEELKLTLSLKGRAVVYSEAQLRELVAALLEQSVPDGFDLSDKDLITEVGAAKSVETEDKQLALQLLVKIKAFVTSQLDEEQVKKDLAGRSISSAQQYLEKLPNISSVKITTFPPLPGPLYRMPRLPSRIDIKLERE